MKKFSKALSILLAVCMIMGTFAVVFATGEGEEVTLPDKILDLDLSGMPSGWTTTTDGGVVNAGTTGNSATFNFKSSTGGGSQLKKSSVTNAEGGITDYLYISNPGYNWANGHSQYIVDNTWEITANTISFWVDINHSASDYARIFEYRALYDNAGAEVKQVFGLDQIFKETNANYIWNIGYTTANPVIMNNSKGWSYVTITNPVLEDGTKTMQLYINGKHVKDQTLTIPAGATLKSATIYLGGASAYSGYPHMAKEVMFGDVSVYEGILTQEQITKLYEDQTPRYQPFDIATAQKIFDLDLTNYVPVKSTSSIESSGGAVNAGTSENAKINMFNYAPYVGNEVYNTKKQMTNGNDEITDYVTWSSKLNWGHAASTYIGDNAWEENDSTISFWTTPNMTLLSNGKLPDARIQAAYNLTYVDGEGAETTVRVPIWRVTTLGFNTGYSTVSCATMKQNEFNHIAFVNKKVDASGNKKVDVYINGAFYKTVSLTQPAGTTLKSAVLSFGEYYPLKNSATDYNTGEFKYGKVQVYKGAFAAGDITSLYELQKPEFTAVTLSEAEKLLDLNVDNFVTTTTAGSSGITNVGTSTTANLDIYSTDQVKVEKQFLMNSDLTVAKPYIYMSHNAPAYLNNGQGLTNHFDIYDAAWTKQNVTISFWVDLDRSRQQMPASQYVWIATYNVDYKNSDGSTGNKETGMGQVSLDLGTSYLWRVGSMWPGSTNQIDMSSSREWSHVAFVVADNREVKMFVNGVERGTVTLDIPQDAEITNASLRFGGDRANKYMPGDLSIVDVKVYKGQFTSDLVKEIYDAEKAAYAEPGEAKVRFYTTSDAEIYKLNDIANDGTGAIKIKYTETIEAAYKLIVVAYDANMEFISANGYDYDAESTGAEFEYTIPENTKYIETFVWEGESLAPIQKKYYIQYNN